MTATTADRKYLIQRFNGMVNLCVSRNGQWVLTHRDITLQKALSVGFNTDSLAVIRVFNGS
jgi:hypothetical protein